MSGHDGSLVDPSDSESPQEIVVSEIRDLHPEGDIPVIVRRLHMIDDRLEKGGDILRFVLERKLRDSLLRNGIHDREVELFVGRIKLDE